MDKKGLTTKQTSGPRSSGARHSRRSWFARLAMLVGFYRPAAASRGAIEELDTPLPVIAYVCIFGDTNREAWKRARFISSTVEPDPLLTALAASEYSAMRRVDRGHFQIVRDAEQRRILLSVSATGSFEPGYEVYAQTLGMGSLIRCRRHHEPPQNSAVEYWNIDDQEWLRANG